MMILALNVLPSENGSGNRRKRGNPSPDQPRMGFSVFIDLTDVSFMNMPILKGVFLLLQ